ncbi:hypothetical protein GCM10027202_34980 [Microvirgula curvata]
MGVLDHCHPHTGRRQSGDDFLQQSGFATAGISGESKDLQRRLQDSVPGGAGAGKNSIAAGQPPKVNDYGLKFWTIPPGAATAPVRLA